MAMNASNLVKMTPLDAATTSPGLRADFIVDFVSIFQPAPLTIRTAPIVTQVRYINYNIININFYIKIRNVARINTNVILQHTNCRTHIRALFVQPMVLSIRKWKKTKKTQAK